MLAAEQQIVEARRLLSEMLGSTPREHTLARRPRSSNWTIRGSDHNVGSPLPTDENFELAENSDVPLARNAMSEMDEVLNESGSPLRKAQLSLQRISAYGLTLEGGPQSPIRNLREPSEASKASRMLEASMSHSMTADSAANLQAGCDKESLTATERPDSQIYLWPAKGTFRFPVLGPRCKARAIWMGLGFMFIVYELFAVPVYVSFEVTPTLGNNAALFVWVCLLSLYFLIDIPVNFMTGYVDRKGRIVLDPRRIARSYIKGGLVLDLLASVPWEWIETSHRTSDVKFLRFMKAFRIFRFLHLLKLKAYMEFVESVLESSSVLTFAFGVMKVLSMLLAVTHWAACFWYRVTRDSIGSTIASNLEHDLSASQRYVYCLYFAWTTMTTVGYGDITPNNFSEVCFVLVLLFISSFSFAYLMGSLTDIIGALNSKSRALAERRTQLSRYLRWRDVPDELLHNIKQHLLFLWETNAGYDAYEEEIKRELPPGLKIELFFHIYGRVVMTAPWLCWMQDYPPCVKRLCNLTSSLFLETGDTIVHVGQLNESVYTLITGSVWLTRSLQIVDTGFSCSNESDLLIPRRNLSKAGEIEERMAKHATRFIEQLSRPFVKQVGDRKAGPQSSKRPRHEYTVSSKVLVLANLEMRKQDMRLASAARRLQRAWRLNEQLRKSRSFYRTRTRQMQKAPDCMLSKRVPAPAYFGESCLWVPLDKWNDPDRRLVYQYTLRCVNRCEVVQIDRAAILDVITAFSPWLAERFERFQQAVVKIMERPNREKGSEEADYSIPVDAYSSDKITEV